MTLPPATLPPGQPDPAWQRRLLLVQRIFLGFVFIATLYTVTVWIEPSVVDQLPVILPTISLPIALSALFCAFSLILTESHNPAFVVRAGRFVALIPAILMAANLLANMKHLPVLTYSFPTNAQGVLVAGSGGLQAVVAFFALSIVLFLLQFQGAWMRVAADSIVVGLGVLVLILISQSLFGTLGLFGLTSDNLIAPLALLCLVLLTAVVVFRQAEVGVFSIFLGSGIGSRIARRFAPVLLVWPFVRETIEAQSGFRRLLPEHFAAAILTALAVAIALLFLLIVVWRINEMEKEIHDLTLRDELTGLYNMRGFYLLAEHTLRLARRAQQPFSVLFLDLDGLKQINDQQGHQVGSAYLAETGEIVQICFREGDVKGRFGGDEFVIAGQFSMVGIEIAAQRLRAMAEEHNKQADRKFPLSFSIGHVTTEHYSTEMLPEMVKRADEAMYKDKRQRKANRR